MPDTETWRFINTFAPWLSALGTTAAVIMSLYLARRSTRPKLRVSMSIMFGFLPGTSIKKEYLLIAAVNAGFRDVTVKGLAWRIRRPWPRTFIVIPPGNQSKNLPAKLTYGDETSFLFPVDDFPEQAAPLLAELRKRRWLSFALRRMRGGVYTSTGEEFLVQPDKHLRQWLRDRVHPLQPEI